MREIYEIIKKKDLPEDAKIVGVTTLKEVEEGNENKRHRMVNNIRVEYYKPGSKKGFVKGYVKIDGKDEYLEIRNIVPVIIISIIALLAVIGLVAGLLLSKNNVDIPEPIAIDDTQQEYVKPETPVNRKKNVSLPGWGSFTIPANTSTITKGFEFHNPETNTWYEISLFNGNELLENMVVDSGENTSIEHIAKLAGYNANQYELKEYNKNVFKVVEDEELGTCITAIGYFDGEETITILAGDKEVNIKATCKYDMYYMMFSLYLGEYRGNDVKNGELLYKSGLVKPGKYIQTMEMTRSLPEGEYDAYVLVEPYKSDQVTATSNGAVKIKLYVK